MVPGFRFESRGFAVDADDADWLDWGSPVAWKVEELSDRHAHYVPSTQGPIERLESNLRAPGFVVAFSGEASLQCKTLLEPVLTIKEASFGPGIQVPESPWVAISLGPSQPPVLAAGLDAPIHAKVSGRAGGWTLHLTGPKRVRLCLPRGHLPMADRTASTLGAIAQAVDHTREFWIAEAPALMTFDVREEGGSLVAEWRFDRAGAVVPPGILLAKQAGCPIQVESLVRLVNAPLDDGPTAFTAEPRLTVRFPSHPMVEGLPLVRDLPATPDKMSPLQVFLGSLFSGLVSDEDRLHAREALVGSLERVEQPITGVPLGFTGESKGALAVSLLALARRLRADPSSDENPSRNELLWAHDERSLTLWLPGQEAADAMAVLALELTLESRVERRLAGSMLATGLIAHSAVPKFREKYGFRQERHFVSRLDPFVRRLLGLPQGDAWVHALDSPLRLVGKVDARLGPDRLLLVEVPGGQEVRFTLLSPSKVEVESVEPDANVSVTGTVNFSEVVLGRKRSGTAILKLTMDRWAKQVPSWPGWPVWLQGPR